MWIRIQTQTRWLPDDDRVDTHTERWWDGGYTVNASMGLSGSLNGRVRTHGRDDRYSHGDTDTGGKMPSFMDRHRQRVCHTERGFWLPSGPPADSSQTTHSHRQQGSLEILPTTSCYRGGGGGHREAGGRWDGRPAPRQAASCTGGTSLLWVPGLWAVLCALTPAPSWSGQGLSLGGADALKHPGSHRKPWSAGCTKETTTLVRTWVGGASCAARAGCGLGSCPDPQGPPWVHSGHRTQDCH